MVELHNGCVLHPSWGLAEERKATQRGGYYDYLVIETTGISEPLPIADLHYE